MVTDTRGTKHPTLHRPQEDIFWGRIIPKVVYEAYFELEIFSELSQQALHLRDLQVEY